MTTRATMMTQNLDMIQQAIEDADKEMARMPLSGFDFRVLKGELDAKLDNVEVDTRWLAESCRKLVATIQSLEEKIDQLQGEVRERNRIIFQIKKAIE